MTKEEVVKHIKDFHTGNLDIQSFLINYAADRGKKDLRMFEAFLSMLVMSGALEYAVNYALDWYKEKYNICTIYKIIGNKKVFITAY